MGGFVNGNSRFDSFLPSRVWRQSWPVTSVIFGNYKLQQRNASTCWLKCVCSIQLHLRPFVGTVPPARAGLSRFIDSRGNERGGFPTLRQFRDRQDKAIIFADTSARPRCDCELTVARNCAWCDCEPSGC